MGVFRVTVTHLTQLLPSFIDDFTTVGGTVSQYAASFGNSWKVPDRQNEVMHLLCISSFCSDALPYDQISSLTEWLHLSCVSQLCSDAAEFGHSCDVLGDASLRSAAEAACHRLLETPFTHCHLRV